MIVFLVVCVQGSTSVTGHVEAALPRPVRALSRAAQRLPHPRGAQWEELGGSGCWIRQLVQLQAPGENSWGYLLFFRRVDLRYAVNLAAISVCVPSFPTCCTPGRCVPCLPDRSQERHPRRADCGYDG